jgi:hypothetical protein
MYENLELRSPANPFHTTENIILSIFPYFLSFVSSVILFVAFRVMHTFIILSTLEYIEISTDNVNNRRKISNNVTLDI